MATSSAVISAKLGGNSGSANKTRATSHTSLHSLHAVYTAKATCLNPDKALDQDVTELNLSKQKYEKDPRQALKETVELQLEIQSLIQDHIEKPFKVVKTLGKNKKDVKSTVSEENESVNKEGVASNVDNELLGHGDGMIREKIAAKKKYLIVHFSHYFILGNVTKRVHFPAEFALAEFSVFNGLGKGLSGLIDIGVPPLGYSHDIRDRQKVTANPYPPFDEEFDADTDALKRIEDFCVPHFPNGETILMFTPKEYIPIVADGFNWLFDAAGRTLNIEVLPLSCLLQILANESQKLEYRPSTEKDLYHVPHESLLETVLHSQQYAFSPDLACEYHSLPENESGVEQCAETMVKRFVFNSSRFLTAFFKLEPRPNMHYPGYKTVRPTVTRKRGGFRIYEMPEGRLRMSDIQQFSPCERINTLLRSRTPSTNTFVSTSQDSLLSSEGDSSSGSSRCNSAQDNDPYNCPPSLSSKTSDGRPSSSASLSSSSSIGKTTEELKKEYRPEDLIDVAPGWQSQNLLRDYQVEPDVKYGYTLNSLNEAAVFLPSSYAQRDSPEPYGDAFRESFKMLRPREVKVEETQTRSQPLFARGRGKRGPTICAGSSQDGSSISPCRPPVQFDELSQDSVSSGSIVPVMIAPRKKVKPKHSKLWDVGSVVSSASGSSVASFGIGNESSISKNTADGDETESKLKVSSTSEVGGSEEFGSFSDLSIVDDDKDGSSSKASFGSAASGGGRVRWSRLRRERTGKTDSTSTIPDSASACGYQVDDLRLSDEDEASAEDDSMSIVALKCAAKHIP